MKILRTYLIREFIYPLFMALGVLTFVMLLGNLIKIADLVINKGVNVYNIGKLFLFMIPYLLTYTVPISVLTAVLLSLGRLSGDNEIIAIRAGGVSLWRVIVWPLLTIGLILSLLLVVFNDRVIPYTHYAARKIMLEIGVKNPTAMLEPGVFINSFERYILFIYHIDQNKFKNIRIYEPQEGKPTRTIIAKRGEFIAIPDKNIVKLKLIDGTADEPDPENPAKFYKLNFKTYFMNLNLSRAQDQGDIEKKPKDMTIKELRQQIRRLTGEGINPRPLYTQIHQKISLAFSCLVFILIGVPLAIITRRREKSINFSLALLVAGAYYIILIGAEALSLQGIISPAIAMWMPNAGFGLIGGILTYRLCVS